MRVIKLCPSVFVDAFVLVLSWVYNSERPNSVPLVLPFCQYVRKAVYHQYPGHSV